MQQTMELEKVKDLAIDEKQRELFKIHAATIEQEAKEIIAGIKNKEGVERAAAWRVKQRDYVQSVEDSPLALARSYYHKKHAELNDEIKRYTQPCKDWIIKVKARMEQWYLDEEHRVKMAQAKATAKALEKAEVKQQQTIQTFMDLGKPKAAEAVARRPLAYTPPTIQMPKIKNAIWKKKYVVQIDDLGALLAFIAKRPEYHGMIDAAALTGKLEGIAIDLDGNMERFKGVRCFVTPNSSAIGGPK